MGPYDDIQSHGPCLAERLLYIGYVIMEAKNRKFHQITSSNRPILFKCHNTIRIRIVSKFVGVSAFLSALIHAFSATTTCQVGISVLWRGEVGGL